MKGLRYYISCFKNGVKNLTTWFPVIWNDRHWDEHYIYMILFKKIEEKIKFFESDNCYTAKSDEVVEQLKVVKNALQRLINDEYYEEACAFYNVEPYDFNNMDNVDRRKIWDLEHTSRKNDIQVIFSKEISEQIEGWWD